VDVSPLFIANAQAAKLIEPGKGSLYDPPPSAQPTAVFCVSLGESWAVETSEALKGDEGHHVQVKAHVDAEKSSVHVTEVKMLKGSETKKEEMKK